jgi:branched-chain amino acid transport system permease protein
MEYLLHIIIVIGLYVTLTASLDLIAGHTGMLSMSHAAFYGVGAYASAICATRLGFPFELSFLVSCVIPAVISLFVWSFAARLREDSFVIGTFAFQMVLSGIMNNWTEVTRGAAGIQAIPSPSIFGYEARSRLAYVLLSVGIAVVANTIVRRIVQSPLGRVLHGIRDDELLTRAYGKETAHIKVVAFAVASAIAGGAGAVYAHYISFIDPTSFGVGESILVLSMLIVGGAASRWGAVVGAVVLVALPEILRFVGLPSSIAANLRQILYGAILVIMIMFRPRGLVGKYSFAR